MREEISRAEYLARKIAAARRVLEALHRGEPTSIKGFNLERVAFIHDNPEHGVITRVTPPDRVDWVVNSVHAGAEPVIITVFPSIGDLPALVEHSKDLVFGGFGSPGIDLTGSVGTVSAKIVRQEGRRPFIFIDHAQGGYRTTKDYTELEWDGAHYQNVPRVRESLPRRLATRYNGWRQHAFGHLFSQTKPGEALEGVNRIVLQRTYDSSGTEQGRTNIDAFANAAGKHGFRVRTTPKKVYAIRLRG